VVLVISVMVLVLLLVVTLAVLPAIAVALLLRRLAHPPETESVPEALFIIGDMR
jgi:hypothetical protein